MADEVAASTMVTYFTSCMAQLRGRAVYVQFSNHKELKTDQTHSNAVSGKCYTVLLHKGANAEPELAVAVTQIVNTRVCIVYGGLKYSICSCLNIYMYTYYIHTNSMAVSPQAGELYRPTYYRCGQ